MVRAFNTAIGKIGTPASLEYSGRRLWLSTLIRLRWLAVAGQTLAVAVVGLWFGLSLPMALCFGLIALSAWLNISLRVAFPSAQRLSPEWATAILAYDLLQLTGLLYLTGGLQNPFTILLLAPVMVSATTMQPDKTFLLGALALIAASLLVFFHQPLPWFEGGTFQVPLHYLGGLWIALACTLIFMAFYAFRVAEEARQLADALAATELVLQREQHLSALDGLAAAAAHELGTPLATIAVVTRELEKEIASDDPHGEDIRLLSSQSQRCREILTKLRSLSSEPEEHFGRLPLSHIMDEITAPYRDFGVELKLTSDGAGPEPVAPRSPGLVHGLGNLVENAVDFAKTTVHLHARWDDKTVSVVISDDGSGFSADIVDRLGEPYVTTRRAGGRSPQAEHKGERSGEHGGLGLGFFIAKTLLERSGARLALSDRRTAEGGAMITVTWSRADFQGGADPGHDNTDEREQ
ncbi:MAG: ActS/PrrB/RegB family redox-sensitive histidine kinase [Hyphomicrobiales bacterium]|nr:ActS/PrrB/RegB family redox-sensitive histidine kinase [Hyphomicrobiales bacterium]